VTRDPEIMKSLMPLLRADFELVETHVPRLTPLRCSLLAFGGADDPLVLPEDLDDWSGYVEGGRVVRHTFPGGHFFPATNRDALFETMLRYFVPA
jgi:medium-chain acyl-[acyl-carrier-protein] hydrolase